MKFLMGVYTILSSLSLMALPSRGEVVKGDATLIASKEGLKIHANGKAMIHWDQFDIGAEETVSFVQSQPDQAILNRVVQGSCSQILGKLEANCPIYLINTQGVFIGTTAHINTAGFIASTAEIKGFDQGSALAFSNMGEGKIVNLGSIHSTQGDIFLVARSIQNAGEIKAPQGQALLLTNEMMVHPETKQTVFVRLSQEGEGIENSGTIQALAVELKTLSPYQKAIHHTGDIEAFTTQENQGRVYLVADQGQAYIEAPIKAESGAIEVVAKELHIASSLLASGGDHGNGGHIKVLAHEQLCFDGELQAQGGRYSGDGGKIHLSCNRADLIHQTDRLDVSAPFGRPGEIFFDPKFVNIVNGGSDAATGNTFGFNPTNTVNISGAMLQSALNSGNVTIQANTDIVFQDQVEASTAGNGLTLQAGRSILMYGNLTLNGGAFSANINDDQALPADRDPGIARFEFGNFSQLLTQGGGITVNVGTFNGMQEGEVAIYSGVMDAGGGPISLSGFARQDGSDYVYGVSAWGLSTVQTSGSGTLSIAGQGGTGTVMNPGIYFVSSGSEFKTAGGRLHLIGHGGGSGGEGHMGIYSAASLYSTTNGPIVLEGVSGNGVNGNMGICISGGLIGSVDGNITLNGISTGSGELNMGVRLETTAQCVSTGSGAISFLGNSGNGIDNNHGVSLSGGSVQAANGSISVIGQSNGAGNYNYGVRLETDSRCISTGTAPVTIQGTTISSLSSNTGVSISTIGDGVLSSYGDINITGFSNGTQDLNQGVRIEMGRICSTGNGASAAKIHLIGTGGIGTDECNGVVILSDASEVTSIDGNIIIEGTSRGSGQNNQPIVVNPPTQVNTTGTGTITYIPH